MRRFFVFIFILPIWLHSVAQIDVKIIVRVNGLTATEPFRICPKDKVTFEAADATDRTTTNYKWTLSNGKSENDVGLWSTSQYSFSEGTTITVTCDVLDKDGGTGTKTETLIVAGDPTFDLDGPSTICTTDDITLNATITPGTTGIHTHTYDEKKQTWEGSRVSINSGGNVTFVPLKNAGKQTYTFFVTDDFGCRHSEELEIEAVDADFETNATGNDEAQFDLIITNKCTHATDIKWYILDDKEEPIDSIVGIEALNVEVEYTLGHPGNYGIKVVSAFDQCTNEKKEAGEGEWVKVIDSELVEESEMPNFFSPNGDGVNDYFTVKAPKSMRSYKVMILSRWGRKVHEYEVSNMDNPQENWDTSPAGWDGKIKGGADAAPGSYFYIINAVGYDDIRYQYKGALYLMRN